MTERATPASKSQQNDLGCVDAMYVMTQGLVYCHLDPRHRPSELDSCDK